MPPAWDLIVDGSSVDQLVNAQRESQDTGTLGTVRATVANSANNRAIESGDDAQLTRDGEVVFEGRVTKAPRGGPESNWIEFTVGDERVELKYEEVSRPFYDMDPGEIIREAINRSATVRSRQTILNGSTTTGWSSDGAYLQLLNATAKAYQEQGSDVIFEGWRAGSFGEYTMTYSNVPSSAIPTDGGIMQLRTRVLVNNLGNQFEGEVDLRDNQGRNYVWQFPILDTNFRTYTFAAEDAEPEATIGTLNGTDGTIQYRWRIKGELPEPRALLIDFADVLPFSTNARSTSLSDAGVLDVGRDIVRRFDTNIFDMIAELAEEYQALSYVDGGTIHFEPGGSETAPQSIEWNATPVTDAKFNYDYDRVRNRVTVQGAGNVQVTAEDSSSIQFYGIAPREEKIVDKEIQTDAEAQARAEGYLQEHAWNEAAMEFEIADSDFKDVRVGQEIFIDWPPEGINDHYVVTDTKAGEFGYIRIQVSGHAT